MTIGIDQINFFTPNAYVDLVELAHVRGVDPDKFTIGIGQDQMAVPPLTQDCYTMGANAAYPLITEDVAKDIDMIIFATESGLDCSKSGAVIMQRLLGIQSYVRSFELKQACYGATAGVLLARDYIAAHPGKKVLVIGSDIARYGLATSGEVTQGAGAVAMIISESPRILALDSESVAFTEDIFDFWRPNYSDTAFVDGKYSNEAYIGSFNHTWHEYARRTQKTLADFKALCFHMPYTKMGKKALMSVLDETDTATQDALLEHYQKSTLYTRRTGNLYTGSLYLSLISLLVHDDTLQAGDTIGLFSYGSGAVGEFFTGRLVEGYQQQLSKDTLDMMYDKRKRLSIDEYETLFNQKATPDTPIEAYQCDFDDAPFYLSGISEHKRLYQKR